MEHIDSRYLKNDICTVAKNSAFVVRIVTADGLVPYIMTYGNTFCIIGPLQG